MIQDQNQRPEPTTNEEWAIHAINIHGFFFERRCQEVVANAKGWSIVDTNYPVTYGDQNSNLDIWAEREFKNSYGDVRRFTLPIECKKNNPDFVDWIFFPQSTHRTTEPWLHGISPRDNIIRGGINKIIPPYKHELWSLTHNLVVADEARETKGDYTKVQKQQDKTKTSNDTITKAAKQITLATQSLVSQERKLLEMSDFSTYNPPYRYHFFLPTIVTTAQLYICEFENNAIRLDNGEIPIDKAKLVPYPYLIFNYAVLSTLQTKVKDIQQVGTDRGIFIQLARFPIFVVQSEAFPTFLKNVEGALLEGQGDIRINFQLDTPPDNVTPSSIDTKE